MPHTPAISSFILLLDEPQSYKSEFVMISDDCEIITAFKFGFFIFNHAEGITVRSCIYTPHQLCISLKTCAKYAIEIPKHCLQPKT